MTIYHFPRIHRRTRYEKDRVETQNPEMSKEMSESFHAFNYDYQVHIDV